MVASRDLTDVTILNRKTGRRMGRAIRAEYRPGNKYITGIVFRTFGLFSAQALLPLACVRTLSARIILADPDERTTGRVTREQPGSIYLSNGRYLGELFCLMLEEYTGLVRSLVIRTSLIDDMRSGYVWLDEPGRLVATINHVILLT